MGCLCSECITDLEPLCLLVSVHVHMIVYVLVSNCIVSAFSKQAAELCSMLSEYYINSFKTE